MTAFARVGQAFLGCNLRLGNEGAHAELTEDFEMVWSGLLMASSVQNMSAMTVDE